jgi:hypothetical protein
MCSTTEFCCVKFRWQLDKNLNWNKDLLINHCKYLFSCPIYSKVFKTKENKFYRAIQKYKMEKYKKKLWTFGTSVNLDASIIDIQPWKFSNEKLVSPHLPLLLPSRLLVTSTLHHQDSTGEVLPEYSITIFMDHLIYKIY